MNIPRNTAASLYNAWFRKEYPELQAETRTSSSAPMPDERTNKKPTKERYFVKPHFGPWREVAKEQYQGFCENIRNGAVNMSETEKEAYIKTVTKITTE